MKATDLALYLVTDPDLVGGRSLEEVCGLALAAGVGMLQFRDKKASTRVMIAEGALLKALARLHGVPFLVNDRVDIALALGADGVHLGQDDLPLAEARRLLGKKKIIGLSVRTPEEARAAERGSADYLAANLVFATATKTDIDRPLGIDGVQALRAASVLPLVAIGGINAKNAASVVAAGADGVAVVSAVMGAPDVEEACRGLLDAVARGRRERHG